MMRLVKALGLAVLVLLAFGPTVAAAGGWLLLAPPVVQTTDGLFYGPQVDAPLSQWLAMRRYDTADECREARATVREQMRRLSLAHSSEAKVSLATALSLSAEESVCIASDDIPRLPTGRGAAFGDRHMRPLPPVGELKPVR